ncbi:MAG: hypothetical protein II822_05580 [Prevotella sp.]|jgi:hypothetical protein|nr:hypothetical protein [Prevotella sp.]
MQNKIIQILLLLFLPLVTVAQKHTEFVGLSLAQAPDELAEKLVEKGLHREFGNELSGRIAGLDVWLRIGVNKDSVGCSYLLLTTRQQQGVSMQEDYVTLMRWMQKKYGQPTWESTVRSHRFARWFIDFDHDIVMVATASAGVEVWFYENHQVRNVDYYAILKYCERYPNDDVPYYTAEDQVTWKSTAPPEVTKKKVSKRHRKVRRHRTKAKRKRRR